MTKIKKLTPREKEIIELKIKGLVDKQIANELGIKYRTVRTYIDRLKLKFNCCNTIQLFLILKDAGLINGDYINA